MARSPLLRSLSLWVLLGALMFLGLGRGLWTPDEPREAEIGREMRLDPGFVPHLNGKPFFEKPPLYYWALAGSYAISSPSQASARAVSGIFGLLTLVLLFCWARRAAGTSVAHAAVFLLAVSVQFFQSTHWVLLDPPLMAFVTLALWGAWEAVRSPGRAPWWSLLMFYGGVSLAIWTKGLVGLAIPAAGILLFAALAGRGAADALGRFRPFVGVPLTALFIALCLGAFYLAEGQEALVQLVWVNHVLRFVKPSTTGHAQPFYYYAQTVPVAVMPWLMVLLALFRPSFWRDRADGSAFQLRAYLAAVSAGGVLLLSLATTKRETYLLPILPSLSLLMAVALEEAWRKSAEDLASAERWLFGRIQPVLLSLWGIALPVSVAIYTRSLRPTTVVLGAAGLLAGIAGVHWGFRGDLRRAWEAHRASAVVLCLSALFLVVPIMELQKDMAPFARWTGFTVPGHDPIAALGADETLCGIIPFTTGRPLEPLSAERLSALAASGAAPSFLVEQRGGDPDKTDLPALGYALLREQRFGTGRSLRLWTLNHPTEPAHP
jgi:4-amino-4-deoxy-L-arabinose transferase-like glycosyltransferase